MKSTEAYPTDEDEDGFDAGSCVVVRWSELEASGWDDDEATLSR